MVDNRSRALGVLAFLCAGLALGSNHSCLGGSNIYLGIQKPRSTVSISTVSHGVYDTLLKKYVNSAGQVDYRKWKASSADRKQLQSYIVSLSKANTRAPSSNEAKLAFWINAYNAVTIEGILREYPTSSIRNHTAKLFGYNIWDDLQLYVGGAAVSINDIEHKILRKMNEPRIHFAIVCASKGCPRLLNQAYSAERVDHQLAMNAEHFFAEPQNLSIRGDTVTLSSILNWFGEDFGSSSQAMLKRIAAWCPDSARAKLRSGRLSVQFAVYDWSLNEI